MPYTTAQWIVFAIPETNHLLEINAMFSHFADNQLDETG